MTQINNITINRFYIRQGLLATLIVFGVLVLLAFSNQAKAATMLRQNNVITDGTIHLGDIFSGLRESRANKVLGPAPHPGKDMMLNARTLMRIAIAMDLSWRPTSNSDYIVLSTAATMIDQDMIKDKLSAALRDRGVPGEFDITLSSDSATEMILPQDADKNAAVQSVDINDKKDWFKAVMVAPSLDNPLQRIKVHGRIERTVEVPVLVNNIRSGTVIGASDIEMMKIPARSITQDILLSADELSGKTPKRVIMSGQPVKSQDVRDPLLVERGKSVTMIFANGGLQLTAMGKALQNGAKGDVIRVVNSASNRTVDAIITNNQEVTVRSF